MCHAPLLKRLAGQRLRQIERQLDAIDVAMRDLCQADPDLKARLAIVPKKVVIVAVMRRLVVLADALLRDQRPWTPSNA
jgi:hypothetical protein